MSISYVAGATASNASQTSLTPTEPAGAAEGDVIVAIGTVQLSTATWTDPADFTELSQENYGNLANVGVAYLGYKVRGADAGSGYAFSHDGAAEQMAVALMCFNAVDTGTPLDVTFVEATHSNEALSNCLQAPSAITTVTDNAWVLVIKAWTGAVAGVTHGAPSGYTLRTDLTNANRSIASATKEVSPAGTETPGVWTTTGTSEADEDMINYTIALRPAGGAAGSPKRRRMSMMGVG